jgi:5-formyltetrahydrofolate cyclo-ligase
MSAAAQALKAELRREIRTRIAAMPLAARTKAATELCARMRQSDIWKTAKRVLLFAPMLDEPDIWPLIQEGLVAEKSVALPRFRPASANYAAGCIRDLSRDLETGQFGLREPSEHCPTIPLTDIELILVPAIAFDLRGHRLGRGKGYYDRLLEEISGLKCGVAMDEQIVTEIPFESHDQQVDWIATPTRLLKIPRTD